MYYASYKKGRKKVYDGGFKKGVHRRDEMSLETIYKIMQVLKKYAKESKKYNYSSYTYKHHVEKYLGEYCSNGELITACLELGIKIRRYGPTSAKIKMDLNLPNL